MAGTKSCFWLFFENVKADEFITKLEHIFETNDNISYICGQLEKGSHLHAQCYVQLQRAQAKSWLINNISPTASYTIQYKKASAEDGRHYCSKPHDDCDCKECIAERATPTRINDTFVEYGTLRKKGTGPGQGERTDLIALRDKALTHCKEREIQQDDEVVLTYAKYMRFYERVRMLNRPPDLPSVDLRLYVGEAGAGKTSKAFRIDEDYYDVPINNGTLWFDGYDQNNVLIFDDFAGRVDHQTLVSTLKLFDRYVRRIPVKGTHSWLRSPIVVVTSNYHPRHWYEWKGREKSYKGLCRRFTSVTVFEEPQEDVFEEVEFVGVERVREYFYDRDLWPAEYNGMDPPFNS